MYKKLRGGKVKAKRIVRGGGVARCIGATERQLPHRTANQPQHCRAPLRDHLRMHANRLLLYRTVVRDYDIMRAVHVHVHGVYGMGTACVPTYTSYSLALGLGRGLGFDVG